MILFLYGSDSFRLQQRLNILKQGFINKYDKDGFNVETLEGDNLKIEDFRKTTLSAGLFSDKRLVVIKNIFSTDKNLQEQIIEELESINKDNIVIFTSTELPKDKKDKLLKQLMRADKVEEFLVLKEGQLYHWIQNEVKNQGAVIDSEAVRYLGEAVGSDLWRMDNEIKKLTSYAKRITIKEADLFIDSPLDDNIFNFMDALSNKNARQAIKLLHDQLDAGANEFYLLTMLSRQIKILLQIKETNGKGLDLHPFVIKKTLPQSKKFSMEILKKLYSKLTEIDKGLKSSQCLPQLYLDMFVVEMCE